MNVIRVIRLFLPLARQIAAATPTPIDDKVVLAIELFLDLLSTATGQADVVAALRQAANEVEKS